MEKLSPSTNEGSKATVTFPWESAVNLIESHDVQLRGLLLEVAHSRL